MYQLHTTGTCFEVIPAHAIINSVCALVFSPTKIQLSKTSSLSHRTGWVLAAGPWQDGWRPTPTCVSVPWSSRCSFTWTNTAVSCSRSRQTVKLKGMASLFYYFIPADRNTAIYRSGLSMCSTTKLWLSDALVQDPFLASLCDMYMMLRCTLYH